MPNIIRWPLWLPALVGLALILLGSVSRPVQAQNDGNVPPEISADEVNAVARELWCPLCSGVRLDTCELKACEQMRQEIAIMLADGKDTAEIKAYFLTQYGPQVLGEPPRSGFNWLAWLLPIVAIAGGAIFLLVRGRSLFTRSAEKAAVTPARPAEKEDDPYARQLDEELKHYG